MDNNQFVLPIELKNDNEYYGNLEELLKKYIDKLKEEDIEKEILDSTNENIQLIMESLRLYLNAQVDKAKDNILKILQKYIGNEFIVSELDRNYAFRGTAPFKELRYEGMDDFYNTMNKYPLSFFKARVSDDILESKDMLHIPFDKRELVTTQRFSISGVPCLYLGATSYVCWLEMGKPNDYSFFVSKYEIPSNIKILNLVSNQHIINGQISSCRICSNENKTYNIQLLKALIEFFPLICATSYSISQKNRIFKSEYIISQLIMQCLKELNIDGIAYMSKKVKSMFEGYPHCVNLAIPMIGNTFTAFNNEQDKYSELCRYIKLTEPVNISEHMKIERPYLYTTKNKSFVNTCYSDGPFAKINFAGQQIFYSECYFSEFDNYLCGLNHNTVNIFNN